MRVPASRKGKGVDRNPAADDRNSADAAFEPPPSDSPSPKSTSDSDWSDTLQYYNFTPWDANAPSTSKQTRTTGDKTVRFVDFIDVNWLRMAG